ncbi:DDT domain-containing protein DDB_G0282237 [Linum perenne]
MPLLKKTPFPLAESPQDLEPEDLVYQVRFTKEIFRDYQEYVNRINLYRQRMWSCKISGKANLTYEEALVSEKHATEKVQGIPEVLVEPALRVIQFSTLSLKDLADTIGVKLLEFKFVGDELHAKKGEHVVPCRILKVLGDSNGKMHYEVKWLERNKKATETSVVSEDELIRKKKPCSRDILKSFIRESTYRRDPWVLHEHLTRKHGISNDLPEELNDKVFFHNGVVCDKKRKNAGDELIKYPIDDLLVQPAADDQVFTERPLPSRNFDVPMDSVGDLLMVWDYCSSFGRLLHLWPFSLEDFENAICRKDGNVILIVETHSALLHLLLKENGDYFLAAKKKNRKLKITLVNWTEYLCDFIEMVGIPGLSASTSTIKRGHYGLLDVQVKIGILRELVNEAVKTVLFRKKIDQYVEQRQVLGAIFRGEALEEARRKREEKEQSRVEDVSNGVSNGHFAVDSEGLHCNQDVSVNKNNDTNGEVLRKHKDQFDREMEKRVIRTEPLGKDRHYNRYWWFQRDGRMFVESSDCKEWGYYSSKEELNALMGSLNPKGERERALQKELEKLYSRICGELQKRSKELVDEIGMEETVVRRSTRVRAMPRENPANSYLRYVNKWKED